MGANDGVIVDVAFNADESSAEKTAETLTSALEKRAKIETDIFNTRRRLERATKGETVATQQVADLERQITGELKNQLIHAASINSSRQKSIKKYSEEEKRAAAAQLDAARSTMAAAKKEKSEWQAQANDYSKRVKQETAILAAQQEEKTRLDNIINSNKQQIDAVDDRRKAEQQIVQEEQKQLSLGDKLSKAKERELELIKEIQQVEADVAANRARAGKKFGEQDKSTPAQQRKAQESVSQEWNEWGKLTQKKLILQEQLADVREEINGLNAQLTTTSEIIDNISKKEVIPRAVLRNTQSQIQDIYRDAKNIMRAFEEQPKVTFTGAENREIKSLQKEITELELKADELRNKLSGGYRLQIDMKKAQDELVAAEAQVKRDEEEVAQLRQKFIQLQEAVRQSTQALNKTGDNSQLSKAARASAVEETNKLVQSAEVAKRAYIEADEELKLNQESVERLKQEVIDLTEQYKNFRAAASMAAKESLRTEDGGSAKNFYNENKKILEELAQVESRIEKSREKLSGSYSNAQNNRLEKDIVDPLKRAEKETAEYVKGILKEREKLKEDVSSAPSGGKDSSSNWYFFLRAIKMSNNELQRLGVNADKIWKNFIKLGNIAAKSLLAVGTGFISLRKQVKSTSNAHNGFLGKLKTGIFTVLKYTLGIRSLYMLMRKLRSALSEGMKNLATAMPAVNSQMSSLVSSLTQMKNAVATAAQPLLNVLAPALEKIADICSRAAVAIASFFAALTGQAFVYRAKKTQQSYIDNAKAGAKATEDEADAQEELNQQLADFDKLNVLTTDKTKDKKDKGGAGDGGIGDMFEKVPLEGFEKLKKWLDDFFYPIKKAWEREGKYVMDAWKYALKQIWDLLKDINRDFMEMWHQEKTIKMFQDIFHTLGDIGFIVGNLARQFRKAWNENRIGFKILCEIRDVFAIIFRTIREIADAAVDWSANLDFYPLLKAIYDVLRRFKPLLHTIMDLIEYFFVNVVMKYMKYLLETAIPKLLDVIGKFFDKINKVHLKEKLKQLMDAVEPFLEKLTEALIIIVDDLLDAIARFVNGKTFDTIIDFITKLMDEADPREMATAIEKLAKAILTAKAALTIISGVMRGAQGILSFTNAFNQFRLLTKLSGGSGLSKFASTLKNLGLHTGVFSSGLSKLKAIFQALAPILVKAGITFASVGIEIAGISSGTKDIIKKGPNLASVIKIVAGSVTGLVGAMLALGGPLGAVVASIGALIGVLKGAYDAFVEFKTEARQLSIGEALSDKNGVPLSDKILDTTEKIRDFGRAFTEASDRTEQLKLAQANIQDTWEEIRTLQIEMDNGALSMEEGSERIKAAFATLAEQADNSFHELNLSIVSAFGEGSAIRSMYEMLGYDVDSLTDVLVTANGKAANSYKALADELQNTEVGSDRYYEIIEQMQKYSDSSYELIGSLQEAESYVNTHQLNLDEFLDDGQFTEQSVENILSSLSNLKDGVDASKDDITAGMTALRDVLNKSLVDAKLAGESETTITYIQQAIDDVDRVLQDGYTLVDKDAALISDALQRQYIDKIPEMVEEANKRWEASGRTLGGKAYGEYIAELITQISDSGVELANGIQKMYGDVDGKASGWSKEFFKNLKNHTVEDYGIFGQNLSQELINGETNLSSIYYDALSKTDTTGAGEKASEKLIDSIMAGLDNKSAQVDMTEPAANLVDEYGNQLEAQVETKNIAGKLQFEPDAAKQKEIGDKAANITGDAYEASLKKNFDIATGKVAGGMPSTIRESVYMTDDIKSAWEEQLTPPIVDSIEGALATAAETADYTTPANTLVESYTTSVTEQANNSAPGKIKEWITVSFDSGVEQAIDGITTAGNTTADTYNIGLASKIEEDLPSKAQTSITTAMDSIDPTTIQESGKTMGQFYGEGYLQGLSETLTPERLDPILRVTQETNAKTDETASPSQVGYRFGKFYGEGYLMGLKEILTGGGLDELFIAMQTSIETKFEEFNTFFSDTILTNFETTLFDEKLEGIKTRFFDEWLEGFRTTLFDEKLEEIKSTFFDEWLETLTTTLFDEKLETIRSRFFDEWLTTFKTTLQTSLEEIKTTITTMIDTTNQTLTTGLESAKTNFTVACDSIVASAETMATAVVAAAARAAAAMASIGGGGIGGINIPIPHLASGAVIPANKKFLAVLGDQKHGTNIEAPLKTIVDAMNISLARNGGASSDEEIALLKQQNQLLQQIVNKDIVVDTNRMFKTVRNEARTFEKSTGIPAFSFT